jgi:hypothetical protein
MLNFSDTAKALNRSPVYLICFQKHFELATFKGAAWGIEGSQSRNLTASKLENDNP